MIPSRGATKLKAQAETRLDATTAGTDTDLSMLDAPAGTGVSFVKQQRNAIFPITSLLTSQMSLTWNDDLADPNE